MISLTQAWKLALAYYEKYMPNALITYAYANELVRVLLGHFDSTIEVN